MLSRGVKREGSRSTSISASARYCQESACGIGVRVDSAHSYFGVVYKHIHAQHITWQRTAVMKQGTALLLSALAKTSTITLHASTAASSNTQ
jgi:hypothetical protein